MTDPDRPSARRAGPRLYLAGPDVFRPDAAGRGAALQALCGRLGAVGLFPLDNALTGAPDLPRAIRDANMAMIRACDAVLADMTPFRGPSMDHGTAYEMGAAAALGKPVIGYTRDPRCYVERVQAALPVRRDAEGTLRDADDMAVEEFATPLVDNLMMACGIQALFADPEAAIAFIVASLDRPA